MLYGESSDQAESGIAADVVRGLYSQSGRLLAVMRDNPAPRSSTDRSVIPFLILLLSAVETLSSFGVLSFSPETFDSSKLDVYPDANFHLPHNSINYSC